MKITSFSIFGLFGQKNLVVPIEDNKLLIVAENGAGKTIVLRLFFLFFSKQWNSLIDYEFDRIAAVVDQKEYFFEKADYLQPKIPVQLLARLGDLYPPYRKFFNSELSKYNIDQLLNDDFLINDIESKYDVPKSLLFTVLNEISKVRYETSDYNWKGSFLYLPTYRRIERDFSHLYGDIGKRLEQHIKQLLPEVDQKIQAEKSLDEGGNSQTENDIQSIFDTIWSTRDFERWAINKPNFHLELIEFGMDDVQYRISHILENAHKDRQNDLTKYLDKCNKYLTNDKRLVISRNQKYIEVQVPDLSANLPVTTLSAGEKQIISLFSYLLYNPEQTWVIIDEPELSLSMSWQEILLNDIVDFTVDGVLIATHSPFIVSSNFQKYTHGINEFDNEQ